MSDRKLRSLNDKLKTMDETRMTLSVWPRTSYGHQLTSVKGYISMVLEVTPASSQLQHEMLGQAFFQLAADGLSDRRSVNVSG